MIIKLKRGEKMIDKICIFLTNRIRKEKLLSEGVLTSLRGGKYISMDNLSKICALLDCQPADLIEYVGED